MINKSIKLYQKGEYLLIAAILLQLAAIIAFHILRCYSGSGLYILRPALFASMITLLVYAIIETAINIYRAAHKSSTEILNVVIKIMLLSAVIIFACLNLVKYTQDLKNYAYDYNLTNIFCAGAIIFALMYAILSKKGLSIKTILYSLPIIIIAMGFLIHAATLSDKFQSYKLNFDVLATLFVYLFTIVAVVNFRAEIILSKALALISIIFFLTGACICLNGITTMDKYNGATILFGTAVIFLFIFLLSKAYNLKSFNLNGKIEAIFLTICIIMSIVMLVQHQIAEIKTSADLINLNVARIIYAFTLLLLILYSAISFAANNRWIAFIVLTVLSAITFVFIILACTQANSLYVGEFYKFTIIYSCLIIFTVIINELFLLKKGKLKLLKR